MNSRPWQKSYPPGFPYEVELPSKATLVSLLDGSFATNADRVAITCLGETLTYSQLDALSRSFAAFLQLRGVKKGDRIALLLPTCLPFIVAMAGALRAGAVTVTVNPLYTPRELEHQLKDSGAILAVVATPLLPAVHQVQSQTAISTLVTTNVAGAYAAIEAEANRAEGVRQHASTVALAEALHAGSNYAFDAPSVVGGDMAFLQYTGGTTGVSKGAILTHRSVFACLTQTLTWARFALEGPKASMITPLPLYHIYPLAASLIAIATGINNRLVPNPRETAAVVEEMRREPFSWFIGVNTLFNGLSDATDLPKVDFTQTKLVTGAGASVQDAVAKRWVAAGGPPITEAYGLTECSPSATFNPPGRNGTIGIPVPSTDVRIVDDEGRDMPQGGAGELLIRGPQLFAGYWQRDSETKNAFTPDGWFKTGDVVTMDATGYMYMVDRKKDMILVSGFNVYPNEIEGVVAAMPTVLECACIGVPDTKSGEVPHLFAVPRRAELTIADIEAHCRANLAAYKVPRHITLVESLPKSTVGKILRKDLRKAYDPRAQ